jgi:hypothetical protein
LPKFVHRKYASLVNIDVGTLLQFAQQKTAKTMKKIFKKKFISDLPTQGFQNKPAAAGARAGATRFTAGYFV